MKKIITLFSAAFLLLSLQQNVFAQNDNSNSNSNSNSNIRQQQKVRVCKK